MRQAQSRARWKLYYELIVGEDHVPTTSRIIVSKGCNCAEPRGAVAMVIVSESVRVRGKVERSSGEDAAWKVAPEALSEVVAKLFHGQTILLVNGWGIEGKDSCHLV